MAESQLGLQLGASVQASLAEAARYLALIIQTNPRGSAEALLARPDVRAVLAESLEEARQDAAAAVEQAWWMSGAAQGAEPGWLAEDLARIFGHPEHLHGLIRRAHVSVPRREFTPGADAPGAHPSQRAAEQRAAAVSAAILGWARRAALRARMTLSYAEGLSSTAAVLEAARDALAAGQRAFKRWRRDPGSASCLWCRRLDGVTLPLHESFAPYLGGPAALPQSAARRVATPAGEAKYHLPAGAPIVYTHPPRLYHGRLQGPLLHPFCRCRLEIARQPGGSLAGLSAPREEDGFLAASEVRQMPEDAYRGHLAFLRAAAGELDAVLRRLAGE